MYRRQLLSLLVLALGLAVPPRLSHAQWRVDGAPVCIATGTQGYQTIVSDGAGGSIIAWEDGRPMTNGDIYIQRLDAAGVPQWTVDGVPLCTAAGNQEQPTIISDGAGGAIVAWWDYRNGPTLDIYVQRVDASGTPQWAPEGVPLCVAANDQGGPRMVPDGAGGAIVTWNDYRSGNWDIYAQWIDASGTPQWIANGLPICTAANHQKVPTITPDGAGGAFVTWYDGRGTSYDIYAQHLLLSGVDPSWTADGVPVCTATGSQLAPTIASDGVGGAIITWGDYRSGGSNIYAQHLLASGIVDPGWVANGVALCTAVGEQQKPAIVEDGANGAIVAWEDGRGARWDIYARRVDAAGVPQWTANGVALCTALDDQFAPAIASDGGGGAIVTWYDYRTLVGDIFVQRVDASGVPQWTFDGAALCTAASNQFLPTITSDGAGGAVVAWSDYRSGSWDIYAQRVYGAGGVADVRRPGGSQRFRLALTPNPARDGRLTIRFDLSSPERVSAQVLDLAGHRVRTLATEREFSSGVQALPWDGNDETGGPLPSGVYFVEIRIGRHSETRRAVLLR